MPTGSRRHGYDLILVARSQDKLNHVASQVRSTTGRKVEVLPADLTVAADVKRVADRLTTDASITAFMNKMRGVAAANKLLESDPDYLEQMIQLMTLAM